MSYLVLAQWHVTFEEEYDTVEEALEAARSVAAEHPGGPIAISGPDFNGSVWLAKEAVEA